MTNYVTIILLTLYFSSIISGHLASSAVAGWPVGNVGVEVVKRLLKLLADFAGWICRSGVQEHIQRKQMFLPKH